MKLLQCKSMELRALTMIIWVFGAQKSSKYLAEIVKTNIGWIFEYLDQMEGQLQEQPTPAMSFLSNPVSGSAGEE